MEDYKEQYDEIVQTLPSHHYQSGEEEAEQIHKYTIEKDEDIRYGNIVYYSESASAVAIR